MSSEPLYQDFSEEVEQVGAAAQAHQEAHQEADAKEAVKHSLRSLAEAAFMPEYFEDKPVDDAAIQEVERLLQLTLDKGILAGLKASQEHPPFIQDAFHDALADKLIPELETRGLIHS